MTSAAVRSEKLSVRATKVAVPLSRVPMAAERRTREAHSDGERAPEISSLASIPNRCNTLLEKPFKTVMAGLKMAVNSNCGRAKSLPISRGLAMAMFLGTSSPISMDNSVAISMAMARAMPATAASGTPKDPKGPVNMAPMEGSMRKPVNRVVRVMPNWQLESCVERLFRHRSSGSAPLSPLSTARCTAVWSKATRENSTATKNPVPRMSSRPAAKSNHSN